MQPFTVIFPTITTLLNTMLLELSALKISTKGHPAAADYT